MGEAILKEWMGWPKEELLALVTDDDTYWRLQEKVRRRNHRLLTTRSPYFDMLNYCATQKLVKDDGGASFQLKLMLCHTKTCLLRQFQIGS